jgi:hypothetical protein
MPWGDRTGPEGRGSMTGRRMGYCAGYDAPGYANPSPGFGRGPGRGRGFGRGRFFAGRRFPVQQVPAEAGYPYPQRVVTLTKEEQSNILEAEKTDLEAELSDIQDEIKRINQKLQQLKKK